jgi:hypothetical protein
LYGSNGHSLSPEEAFNSKILPNDKLNQRPNSTNNNTLNGNTNTTNMSNVNVNITSNSNNNNNNNNQNSTNNTNVNNGFGNNVLLNRHQALLSNSTPFIQLPTKTTTPSSNVSTLNAKAPQFTMKSAEDDELDYRYVHPEEEGSHESHTNVPSNTTNNNLNHVSNNNSSTSSSANSSDAYASSLVPLF